MLEGESLRQRLQRGSLSVRKAIEYGIQIAQGLSAAHDKGIAHRDLKPENLFLTKDGHVKILDFGLAKLPEVAAGAETIEAPVATLAGTVLGTVGYMSPEQVRGEPADHRSDVFSLGAVLYEMFTGRRAFTGPTSVETMNAILKEEPPAIPPDAEHVPAGVQRILDHSLEKEPEQRFQSARDLAFALTVLSDRSSGPSHGDRSFADSPRGSTRTAGPVAALAIAAGIFAEIRPSWSTDGNWIYFGSHRSGRYEIWEAPAEGGPAAQVTRDGGYEAFCSPDGRFLFYSKDLVSPVWGRPIDGGVETLVLDEVRNGRWGAAGNDFFLYADRTATISVLHLSKVARC